MVLIKIRLFSHHKNVNTFSVENEIIVSELINQICWKNF